MRLNSADVGPRRGCGFILQNMTFNHDSSGRIAVQVVAGGVLPRCWRACVAFLPQHGLILTHTSFVRLRTPTKSSTLQKVHIGGKTMDFFKRVAVMFVAGGLGTSAFAADLAVKAPAYWPNDIALANNQWYLDVAFTHFDYRETFAGATLDTEKGWAPGGQTSFTVQRDWLGIHNFYYNGTFTWTHGDITHGEANPVFNGIGTHSDLKDWDFRVGKGFEIGANAQITPYAGAGTHWWTRTFPGPGGYRENYFHSYAGGGLLLQYAPASHWVLAAYGLVGGTFDSHLDVQQTPGGFPIPVQTFRLGNSVIYLAGASVDYAITKEWHANAGVDYTNFRYGQSPIGIGGFFEPDSRTSNFTVKAGFGYSLY